MKTDFSQGKSFTFYSVWLLNQPVGGSSSPRLTRIGVILAIFNEPLSQILGLESHCAIIPAILSTVAGIFHFSSLNIDQRGKVLLAV